MADPVVVTRDLMDGSRFRSAVPGVVIVRSVDAPELAGARIVLVDLALGVLDQGENIPHPQNPGGESIRVKRVQRLGFLPDTQELDGLARDGAD